MAVAMAGGYRVWAERLRHAQNVSRQEANRLASPSGGPFFAAERLSASGEVWGGHFAEHLRGLIRSLEHNQLGPLADHLSRMSGALDQLASETESAASSEMAGLPPPPGFDLFRALAPFRMWPAFPGALPADWARPRVGGIGGFVFVYPDRVRDLARRLQGGAEELRAARRRLGAALERLGLEPPGVLDSVALAADQLAGEVMRRLDLFEDADRRVAGSFTDSLSSAARAATAAAGTFSRLSMPTTREGWRKAALGRAGIDPKGWKPSKGLGANDANVRAVYRYYGQLWLDHPELQWAGMANLVGPTFYAGWQDLAAVGHAADRHARSVLLGKMLGLAPGNRLVEAAAAKLTAKELRWFEERMLIMQRKIFQDLAWQHEAYLQGGISEMRRLAAARQLRPELLRAWEDIASGEPERIAKGNRDLLYREQKTVIQEDYSKMRRHHPPVGEVFTRVLGLMAENPIPGGRPYRDVVQHVDLPDLPNLPNLPDLPGPLPDLPDLFDLPDLPAVPRGNVARFDDRWEWIADDMLPAYRELLDDPDRMSDLVETPVSERAASLRRLPALEYRNG